MEKLEAPVVLDLEEMMDLQHHKTLVEEVVIPLLKVHLKVKMAELVMLAGLVVTADKVELAEAVVLREQMDQVFLLLILLVIKEAAEMEQMVMELLIVG